MLARVAAGRDLGGLGAPRCHGSLEALPKEILMPVTEGPFFLSDSVRLIFFPHLFSLGEEDGQSD